MRYGGRGRLTSAQQHLNLRSNPLSAGKGDFRRERLVWRCDLSPSPLGRTYSIRIEYRSGSAPKVFVEAPNLIELAGGKRLPHVYQQDPPQLCLYLPKSGEWAPWMRIDQTIVPWAVLWFFYFEDWLRTGVWSGGGMHPDGKIDGESEDFE
jgi:hypothetical protein